MIDLDIHSVFEYLIASEFNYVIVENGYPIVWDSDNTPVVFGGEEDVMRELNTLGLIDDSGKISDMVNVFTEKEFIETYCLDAISIYLFNRVMAINESDGVNIILHLSSDFNNIIDIDNMTDILTIYADKRNESVSFLIASNDDEYRSIISISEIPIDVIINIVKFVENYSS